MKLTRDTVAALAAPAGKSDHIEWDDDMPGFGVRLRGETKRWVVQYRVGSQQRRESLGDVRKVTLDDARRAARQRFAKVELGVDPRAEREAASAKITMGQVADRYLEAKKDTRRPNTYRAARLHFTVHWAPFRARAPDAITRADLAARLQELTKAHGRGAAAAARRNLSALYTWAMKEGLCESNPVIATNNPAEGAKARDRVLADDEIAVIWSNSPDSAFGSIVRLLLLTGARREEIGGLRWNEINFDTGVMTIPGERTKNHRALVLTLPPAALDILRSVPRPEGRTFVFGTRMDQPYSGWGFAKLSLDARIMNATGRLLAPWRLHDLRRSMRTGLGKLGVAPHVAELCVNHVKGGVEGIYDRHRYEREKAAALMAWADHVLAVVEGREPDSNVVTLMPSRA
jgi:integrase